MIGKDLFLFAVNNNLLYDIDYCKKQKNYYQIIFIYYLIILFFFNWKNDIYEKPTEYTAIIRDTLSAANSDIITQNIKILYNILKLQVIIN